MFRLRNFVIGCVGTALLLSTAGAGSVLAKSKSSGAVTDDDLGLRKGSLLSEDKVMPAETAYPKAEAGSAKTIKRSFENSPALIPHDIDGMLPITLAHNECTGCHMPDAAKAAGATPIPRSHLMKLAAGKDLNGKLDGERFNCVECHVRQAAAKPPVKNTFRAGFKNRGEMTHSDLADTVNEGVKGD